MFASIVSKSILSKIVPWASRHITVPVNMSWSLQNEFIVCVEQIHSLIINKKLVINSLYQYRASLLLEVTYIYRKIRLGLDPN